jgi:hypothetical protein
MQVEWYGQSAFRLSSSQQTVAIDPFADVSQLTARGIQWDYPAIEGVSADLATRVGLTTQDADADHAALKARGVDVDEDVMRMGDPVPPMFFFRDLDGNKFMVVERG